MFVWGEVLLRTKHSRMGQICGRQPLKNMHWHVLLKQNISIFLKTIFNKFSLAHSWIHRFSLTYCNLFLLHFIVPNHPCFLYFLSVVSYLYLQTSLAVFPIHLHIWAYFVDVSLTATLKFLDPSVSRKHTY